MTIKENFQGKSALVTGHTGFKGAWAVLCLSEMGCKVSGLALDPEPQAQRLFDLVAPRLYADVRGNICDSELVAKTVKKAAPDYVFHLAAQALVIESYRSPLDTVRTNVLGTASLLDAVRQGAPEASTVIVTTDKCYEDQDWCYAYRESDPLGGHDVYAASKAAAEMVTEGYRRSFFESDSVPGKVATARGGNVVGGGDFSKDRIVPDAVRALRSSEPIQVRNPLATRPWQHVLDCLSGYFELAQWLESEASNSSCHRSFNFGPRPDCERTVNELVAEILANWSGEWKDVSSGGGQHEASRLRIAIELAESVLGWTPGWTFEDTIARTTEWYRAESEGASDQEMVELMISQLKNFQLCQRK